MAIQVRKGTSAVLPALVASFNALRTGVADASPFVHRDVTAITAGDFTAPRTAPVLFAAPPAADLASLLRLCAEIGGRHAYHLSDAFAHKQADVVNGLAGALPIDLPTAQAWLTDAKAKWNAHLTAPGVHVNGDTQPITAPNATTLQTALDLANTYRAVYGTHIQNALPGAFVELIDP